MYGTPTTVGDVMTRTVVALRRGATFKDIVKAMQRWGVSALPVIDEGNRVLGVVTHADLLHKEEFRDDDSAGVGRIEHASDLVKAGARTAEELMTTPAVTTETHHPVARAARMMAYFGVESLPVVGGEGVLQGIVSRSDLLKVFLRSDEDIAREVRYDVVGRLFRDAPETVRVEVREGVVRLTGRARDATLIPLATRLTKAVEGVVAVDCELLGPRRRPVLDPDLPDDGSAVRPSAASGPA
ncbi:CBS domain-containing protein [Streptomyces sp. NPDC049627]|uniref:CBS domain-containing protein n=1 Tax=Streptomyces sp. NPDC049627 TaxID=3365595 RepID=UPI0037999C01